MLNTSSLVSRVNCCRVKHQLASFKGKTVTMLNTNSQIFKCNFVTTLKAISCSKCKIIAVLFHILSLLFYQGAHSWQRYTRGWEDVLGRPPGSARRRKAATHVLLQSFPHCCMMGHWHWKLSLTILRTPNRKTIILLWQLVLLISVSAGVCLCVSAWLLEGVQDVQRCFQYLEFWQS